MSYEWKEGDKKKMG